ncbi:MAG: hypothetical protein KAT06_12440 [Gammaproteobacteria bacterium]|nr:hypothetical protein [Gammaproteobacteria bacterium]
MKILSDNLLMLALAIVLAVSPLQNIAASVSKCVDMDQTMHHQMKEHENVMQHDMTQSEPQHDCCEQTACDMTHCATTVAAVITSDSLNKMTYTVSNVVLKPNVTLIQFYPSSLYRPPKV